MATTINLLDYNNALLRRDQFGRVVPISSYSTDWVISGSSQINSGIVSDAVVVDNRYSFIIDDGGSSSSITITLASKDLRLFDSNRVLSFNCKIKSTSNCTISTRLSIDGEATPQPNVQSLNSGNFNAIHSNRVLVPETEDVYQYTIQITISARQGASIIHITNFHLIHDFAFYENAFVPQMRRYMPDFYWEYDSDSQDPTYPFFKLVDVLSSGAGVSRDIYDSIFPFDTDEFLEQGDQVDFWAKSTLTTPSLVRDEYVPWLSQFNGVKIQKNVLLSDGTPYFNNPSLQRDFIEWQLRNGYYGRAAGSRIALLEAAKQFLVRTKDGSVSSKSVAIGTRYNNDPFSILVQTLANETLDANDGESSSIILQSLNLAKPLGYKIIHSTVDDFDALFDNESLARFDEFVWA